MVDRAPVLGVRLVVHGSPPCSHCAKDQAEQKKSKPERERLPRPLNRNKD